MSLKVELKPGERFIIGDCVVTNSDQRTRLFIDGKAPILREKDILTAETANTPAKRVYFAIQLMYLEDDIVSFRQDYFQLINEIVKAAPSMTALVDRINNEILTGALYKALKVAKKLIQYEQELIAHAEPSSSGISASRPENDQST